MGSLRRIADVTLALMVALAVPVAILAWLAGAHITLAHGRQHTLALDQRGEHRHGDLGAHQADTRPGATDQDLGIRLTSTPPAAFGGLWQAVTLTLLAVLALRVRRHVARRVADRAAQYCPIVASPPPRA